jgi:hypothetical protein
MVTILRAVTRDIASSLQTEAIRTITPCALLLSETRVNAIKVTTDIEDTDLRYLCLSVLARSFPGYGYPLSSYHDPTVCENPERQEERQREAGSKLMPLLLVVSSKGSNLERIAQVWWECEVAVQWHGDTSQLGTELANTIDPILEHLGEAEFKAEFGDTFRQSANSRLPAESDRSAPSVAIGMYGLMSSDFALTACGRKVQKRTLASLRDAVLTKDRSMSVNARWQT